MVSVETTDSQQMELFQVVKGVWHLGPIGIGDELSVACYDQVTSFFAGKTNHFLFWFGTQNQSTRSSLSCILGSFSDCTAQSYGQDSWRSEVYLMSTSPLSLLGDKHSQKRPVRMTWFCCEGRIPKNPEKEESQTLEGGSSKTLLQKTNLGFYRAGQLWAHIEYSNLGQGAQVIDCWTTPGVSEKKRIL